MTRKPSKTKKQALSGETHGYEPNYVSWDGDLLDSQADKVKAFEKMSEAVEEYQIVSRTTAHFSHRQNYSNLSTDISGRPGLTRRDYELHRPDEAVPRKIKEILSVADSIYQRVGLIRNIVDLMGDFTCQGVRIVHPNKRIEKFYRKWARQIGMPFVSERIANNLFRSAVAILNTQTAKLSKKDQLKFERSMAKDEIDMDIQLTKVANRVLPWKYTMIDPLIVDVVGGPLSSFVSQPIYGIKLPDNLKRAIRSPQNPAEAAIVAKLPKNIKDAAAVGTDQAMLLDPDKTTVLHYKKDDWQPWAFPMIYAVMDDIFVLEKLKLADVAALDGAISNIRIFKLGSLEHSIAPTREAATKLAGMLQAHTGVGTLDMIWGPDIELIETSTNVHQFLGAGKYEPTLAAIYAGLGIPPTLTGTGGAGGTTNNFVSLQTLINRLDYGRSVLREFWEAEFVKVQKAMGFRFPAKLEFDHPNLGDTQSSMALMVQLADRNLISDELLREHFKHDPEMEKVRINREARDRKAGRDVPKAGAFHDPQFDITLKKVFAQSGAITPSQAGLDLPKPKKGEQPAIKMKPPTPGGAGKPGAKKPGVSGQGRPKNSKDTTKRKTKRFTPKSKAVVELWAKAGQEAISEFVNPYILEMCEKSNMRKLTETERVSAEAIKLNVLWGHDPLGEISQATVVAALQGSAPEDVLIKNEKVIKTCSNELNRKLSVEEVRTIQAATYAEYHGDDKNG